MGWRYRTWTPKPGDKASLGGHGYDPDSPEMAAMFIANGPAFRAGARLAKFPNVSVYPLLAKLAGVTPEAGDGSLSDVQAALK
jgi:hypothetical protein